MHSFYKRTNILLLHVQSIKLHASWNRFTFSSFHITDANDFMFFFSPYIFFSKTSSYKTLNIITQEDFEKMAPKTTTKNPDVPPPPPPTYDNSSRHNQSIGSGLGSKKARFFAVNKEEFIDPRTPRKRKTRHLYNPPVESHVGWVCCQFILLLS